MVTRILRRCFDSVGKITITLKITRLRRVDLVGTTPPVPQSGAFCCYFAWGVIMILNRFEHKCWSNGVMSDMSRHKNGQWVPFEEVKAIMCEVQSVLSELDNLAEVWGDDSVFRRCLDRLRTVVSPSQVQAMTKNLESA